AWSHVRIERSDNNTLKANVSVCDDHGTVCVQIENLRFRKTKRQNANVDSWLYRLAWEPAELNTAGVAKMLAGETARVESHMKALSGATEVLEYQTFFAELERLAADYVLQAFAQLGWPRSGQKFTMDSLVKMWSIDGRYRRLFGRLLEIAVETGAVQQEAASYIFGAEAETVQRQQLNALIAKYPFGRTEIDLVVRCGDGLVSVLAGRLDGHELVFPRGQSDAMTSLYRDSTPARIFNEMVAGLVKRAVDLHGADNARVLEVGGGTGATTQYIFNSLKESATSSLNEYLFTDISPLLVRRAQQSFGEWDSFSAKVLDLERPSEEQGIAGPFNAIVAVNVVHATSDLAATIERLKRLLSPDGLLIMVEVIGKQRWADITVGLLDGWWSFVDSGVRADYPALASGQWESVLTKQGFGRVVCSPKAASPGSLFSRQQLIVAAAPAQKRRVVLCGDTKFSEATRKKLERLDSSVEVAGILEAGRIGATVDAVVWFANYEGASVIDAPAGAASHLVEGDVRSLLAVAQLLLGKKQRALPRLYIVTAGVFAGEGEVLPQFSSPLVGMARGIAMEAPELRCTSLECFGDSVEQIGSIVEEEICGDSPDQWVRWRGGKRSTARLQRVEKSGAVSELPERVKLQTGAGIDALAYIADAARDLVAGEVEIAVRATALNFRDVLQSMGVVNLNLPVGTDCAGIVTRIGEGVRGITVGDRVVAVAPGSFASHVVTDERLVVRKPKGLTFQLAAAQSVAYLTADYCLNEIAQIKSGERVLIHAAAGGVGLAAVHLCRQRNAVPIATAGSERKRDYLRRLGVELVYDSRSADFAAQIAQPVDVVLNSLAGDAIDKGLSLLAPGGRFIEMGKTDVRDPKMIAQRWPHVDYKAVDLSPLFAARSPWVAARLTSLLNEIADRKLPMLPARSFAPGEMQEAFRYMARAEHIGRIVIERNLPAPIEQTHIVTGGMRGIGLRLAEWLASEGATALVLVGRNAPDGEASSRIDRLQTAGVDVRTVQGDIADPAIAVEAIRCAGDGLRGVWHSAGLLDNASLEDQSWQRMEHVFGPKVDGAWNLHKLTEGTELDYFVMFSSWASIGGSQGQVNHCAANAFMDNLAYLRRSNGAVGLSLNWGAWGETGAAATEEIQRQLSRGGMDAMAPADALEALRSVLREAEPQVAIAAINWPRYIAQRQGLGERLLYASVLEKSTSEKERRSRSVDGGRSRSTTATTAESARETSLPRIIADVIRRTLDLRPDEAIDPALPLSELGMDSLLAIELRNNLSNALGRQFPSTILFDYPTLRDLAGYIEREREPQTRQAETEDRKGATVSDASINTNADSSFGILDSIERMSDEEVDLLYQQENHSRLATQE
ncbi:MAG: SDR family NAD(P)-dependent oxidoreductase, partial [Acidobacteria bacterium]|nr:SDR family NAD(P)-dependent oxidoreductase [Acidobacteriota bacterium]